MAFKPRFGNKNRVKDNVNEGIRVPEVRAIFPDGANEILPTYQAIQKAKALNLDLILISPAAKPPVAKVMDHGKWTYEQKKQKQEAKANQHVIKVKELKFRPGTEEHDYDFKRNHALTFLKEKNKVKAIVQFKGREVTHANLGIELLQRLLADVADVGKAEFPPRQEGKQAFVMIVPK
jgi:translation initiation factor IF-3